MDDVTPIRNEDRVVRKKVRGEKFPEINDQIDERNVNQVSKQTRSITRVKIFGLVGVRDGRNRIRIHNFRIYNSI